MPDKVTHEFWVFEPALVPTLLILAHLAKYEFNEDYFNAIEYGLTATSHEKNVWWTYQFTGDQTIDLSFARDDDNTDIIFIKSTVDKDLGPQLDLTIFVVQEFDLEHKHYKKY